nr:DUF262 domain-containing protein [uncultured Macellibacteroides sp.]
MAKQRKRKLTISEKMEIEEQIRIEKIPYDYDTKEYPIEVIKLKYSKGQLFVPEYQRDFVWDEKQSSRFLESILLGVPIMPFLVSSVFDGGGRLEIIDGSQRIRSIYKFLNNEFKLKDLHKLDKLEGLYYEDLPEWVKNDFMLRDFRFHVITEKADFCVRADIFDRVNTSSKKLTDSEIRKGAFQGEFYSFIIDCARNELFRSLCPISGDSAKRGEYEELVCRFFAYSEKYTEARHEVAGFINRYIQEKTKTGFDRTEMERDFNSMLTFVQDNFAPNYFSPGRKATPRVRFEAIAVGVCLALNNEPTLKISNIDWINSKEFKEKTTSDASNNPGRLVGRIEYVRDQLLLSKQI